MFRHAMKAAVSLRLRPSRTNFQVFFPYSDMAVRTALLGAGMYYDAAARGYLLPADAVAVAGMQMACQQQGLVLHAPAVPALVVGLPPPNAHEVLLSRYCQFIALKHYNPNTLKNYRAAFKQFLAWCASRVPLDLAKADVLDYLAGRVAAGISETYQNLLINAIIVILKMVYILGIIFPG